MIKITVKNEFQQYRMAKEIKAKMWQEMLEWLAPDEEIPFEAPFIEKPIGSFSGENIIYFPVKRQPINESK